MSPMMNSAPGTFEGHAVAGSAFIVVGVWWSVQMHSRYHVSVSDGRRFRSAANFACDRGKCNWPIEAIAKIVFAIAGICVESVEGYSGHGAVDADTGAHFTMYAYFGMSGVIDILIYFRVSLPPGCEYVALFLAFVVEGFTFSLHTTGRSELNVFLHSLLKYVVFASAVVVLAEMRYRHVFMLGLARAYLTCLQGTWFVHLGFILYSPLPTSEKWDEHDHDSVTTASVYFEWHMAAIFAFTLALGGLVKFCVHRRNRAIDELDTDAAKPMILGIPTDRYSSESDD